MKSVRIRLPNVAKVTMWILLFAGMAMSYRLVFWPIERMDRNFVVPDAGAITFVDINRHTVTRQLYSKHGIPFSVSSPAFTIHGAQLYYWSHVDTALGLVRGDLDQAIWFPVGQHRDHWPVRRISTDGRFVALNIGYISGEQSVLLLDQENGEWRNLEDVTQVLLDPSGSGQAVMQTVEGEFLIGYMRNEKDRLSFFTAIDVLDWDYSFDTHTLYIIERKGKFFLRRADGTLRDIDLPFSWNALSVYWQRGYNELWVFSIGLSSAIYRVAVFSSEGDYLGALRIVGPQHYFQEVDPKDIRSVIVHLDALEKEH